MPAANGSPDMFGGASPGALPGALPGVLPKGALPADMRSADASSVGVVVASYGTVHAAARERDLAPLVATVMRMLAERAERDGVPLRMVEAFSSPVVRSRLAARGEAVPGVAEALGHLADEGVRRVVVALTHVVDGRSVAAVRREVAAMAPRFERLELARPLLATQDDVAVLAGALDRAYGRRPAHVWLLVGHGVAGTAPFDAYGALARELARRGREDMVVALLHGAPGLDEVERILPAPPRVRAVSLVPLMVVAGGHALRDVAGSQAGSWEQRLRHLGYATEVVPTGLGRLPEVAYLVVSHVNEAM